MKLRNLLFAPGDSARKAEKAFGTGADCVILDLEDSVAPGAKVAARAAVAEVLSGRGPGAAVVRVNAQDTSWYLADLAAVVGLHPSAILLPKCDGPAALARLDHNLEALEQQAGVPVGSTGVIALVTETARSLARMDYVGCTPRLRAVCFGAEDLSADLGVRPRGPDGAYTAPVAAARAATLLAAAQAGIPAIDTPWPDPRDPDGLAREAAQAAADGFAGKLCIHPAQVEPVAAAFTPAPDRVQWAEKVRDLFAANPGAGVMAMDGKMVDRPHLKLAERILASV